MGTLFGLHTRRSVPTRSADSVAQAPRDSLLP
jgi:hypothetical protein